MKGIRRQRSIGVILFATAAAIACDGHERTQARRQPPIEIRPSEDELVQAEIEAAWACAISSVVRSDALPALDNCLTAESSQLLSQLTAAARLPRPQEHLTDLDRMFDADEAEPSPADRITQGFGFVGAVTTVSVEKRPPSLWAGPAPYKAVATVMDVDGRISYVTFTKEHGRWKLDLYATLAQ